MILTPEQFKEHNNRLLSEKKDVIPEDKKGLEKGIEKIMEFFQDMENVKGYISDLEKSIEGNKKEYIKMIDGKSDKNHDHKEFKTINDKIIKAKEMINKVSDEIKNVSDNIKEYDDKPLSERISTIDKEIKTLKQSISMIKIPEIDLSGFLKKKDIKDFVKEDKVYLKSEVYNKKEVYNKDEINEKLQYNQSSTRIVGGINNISEASDVKITSPEEGQVLVYNETTHRRENQTSSGGSSTVYYDAHVSLTGDPTHHTTLKSAILAGAQSIFIYDGVYNETTIKIEYDGVFIQGESKKGTILRRGTGVDCLACYGNNCYINNLTLDGETNNSASVYIVGDGQPTPTLTKGNNNIIENCIIKGSNNTFCIFVAGFSTSVGSQTLTYFENNDLQTGNIVRNCELSSAWTGDSFSFSLQKNGMFSNNVCYGGRIAFYMCRNSACNENNIVGSVNQGIFIAGPCYANTISNNTIYAPTSSGIKLQNQLEHTPLLTGQGIIGNTITNNTIHSAGSSGIEISGTANRQVKNNNIANNTVNKAVNHGIYLQEASCNTIANNVLLNPKSAGGSGRGSGVYMVSNVKSNTITGNTIDGVNYHSGIANREDGGCTGNIIANNTLKGTSTERAIWIQSNETVIEGNSVDGVGYYAGIRLLDASFCTIQNNKLKNNTNQANNAYAEIWLQGSSTYNIIGGNIILSTASNKANYGINIDGAGCIGNVITKNIASGPISGILLNTGLQTNTFHKLLELEGQSSTFTYNGNNQIVTITYTNCTAVNTYNGNNQIATTVYTFSDSTVVTMTASYSGTTLTGWTYS